MTLTPRNSQVHCSGVTEWWACSSLLFHSFAWTNLGAEFIWCWCLLCNSITAAYFQRFASSYDRRRFTSCCVWTLVPRRAQSNFETGL